MKDRMLNVLQRVGRSFMLPIAILPVAGLLLGIGESLSNPNMIAAYGLQWLLGEGTFFYMIFKVMSNAGNIVFTNLPLIFAMGVALGMAKKEKEVAVLASAISFFIMHTSIATMLELTDMAASLPEGSVTSVTGITSLQMGMFGGVLVGLGTAALHNRFYKIQLPRILSFFGGTRFVPIICSIVYLLVGILMFYIWPVLQEGIYMLGDIVQRSGYYGTFLYGVIERALIPFGLHHVFYLPFWQTAVGGTMEIAGVSVQGAQNIFFAQLADPNTVRFSVEATRFMSGKFPLMMFGLPGAALAMYHCALAKKQKIAGGLLISAALTSMLTGITEPLEYTFLFAAPLLYVIHCVLAGCAFMFMHMLQVGVGLTFSGGLIDLFLFGILQGNAKTNWIMIVIVGVFYFIIYYVLFTFLIKRFDFKTPGRESESQEIKVSERLAVVEKTDEGQQTEKKDSDADALSSLICAGLGGKDNIISLDCCATRLHVAMKDPMQMDDILLQASGAAGIYKKSRGLQIIYGPRVTIIKSDLEDYLLRQAGKE